LRRQRVLIPQAAYVFSGTLAENLTYLADEATPADIDQAVGQLGMRALVERLGGYDADVDPSALSAGQRQLLAPARLVVLDEATCHLDPDTEARVERAFARRTGTLIVIAHRISSAVRARRILVMNGTRVLLGTHDDLLRQSALYRDLVGYWHSGAVPAGVSA
jgi:ATP-binding cassette subfamily C protein